jgi:16S rRNA (cytosine967-C5)-methyltransferase
VIDVCAAPGGKTLALAEKMGNKGRVIACDIYEHKLKLIQQQAKRLGIDIVENRLLDGEKGDSSLDNTANMVLADVPCSGLGVIRRKPEIKYKDERKNLKELIEIQKKILQRAASYVKSGGTLVYSTCTINKAENQEQIETFLHNNSDFVLVEQKQFLPTDNTDGFFICKFFKQDRR